jgi:hypothetical protein
MQGITVCVSAGDGGSARGMHDRGTVNRFAL